MTDKYVIIMLCDDGDACMYTDYVNMIYNSREEAEKEMRKCIIQEYESLAENESNWKTYSCDDNTVYVSGRILTRYNVIQLTNEKAKEKVSLKDEVLSESFPDVSPAMHEEALCAFRHFFEIDDNDEEYACGSLEKLAIIIGKDYRYSDLLFEIARDFLKTFDSHLDVTLDAWKRSIKRVIGEDKYEMAFEETDPKPLTDEEFTEFQKAEKRKENMIGVISSAILDIIDFFL